MRSLFLFLAFFVLPSVATAKPVYVGLQTGIGAGLISTEYSSFDLPPVFTPPTILEFRLQALKPQEQVVYSQDCCEV